MEMTMAEKALARAFYSKEVYSSLKDLIATAKPDVAYVLHYLRKLSPSILLALKEADIPIVVRLSDFGMLCPELHFQKNGRICELCMHGNLFPSVRYRCVKGSLGASLINALATIYHRNQGYFDLIDAFIAPTVLMKQKMVEGGWPTNKIFHLSTFVDHNTFKPEGNKKEWQICYAGRIASIKGINLMVNAFKIIQSENRFKDLRLVIAGNEQCEDAINLKKYIGNSHINNIEFTGFINKQKIAQLLAASQLSVVPSLSPENMPNVLLESLAAGTPVIASNIGCFPETLKDNAAGILFRVGDQEDLAAKICSVLKDRQRLKEMSRKAREVALVYYNGELHYKKLMKIFAEVIQQWSSNGVKCPNLSV